MKVTVVICTYNRAEQLRTVLRSLGDVEVPEDVTWEVLVVDNRSTDHTRGVVEGVPASLPCRYVYEPRQGKSFALNTAVTQAGGDIIAFTDDDVTVDRGWLDGLCRAFADPRCLGVGGRVKAVWRTPKPSWYIEAGPYRLMMGVIVRYEHGDHTIPAPMLPFGANMAFRREAFQKYGGFDTELGPVGTRIVLGEDADFCRRVEQGGDLILYVPDAIVYHPVPAERARKQYFLHWYYLYGRYDPVREPPPPGAVLWFGVPRYLLRNLAESALAWLTAFEPGRRFFHKLAVYRYVGAILQSFQLGRDSGPHPA